MKKALSILTAAALAVVLLGCVTAINTKDVTKITETTTGLKICQSQVDKTPQLIFGREQVEYIKVPTGLNSSTNAPGEATQAGDTPTVVSSYELNGSSPVFGRATMTTTFAVGSNGVVTTLGGAHVPINEGAGGSPVETVPGALTNAAVNAVFSAPPAGSGLPK